MKAVKIFADNVLEKGIDRWSGKNTPLFADGLNIFTNEPLEYSGSDQQGKYIRSNLASHQNLFRTFVGLSNLTGDPKYEEAAEKSIRYHFDNLCDHNGLLHWGSSEFIDLRTLQPAGCGQGQNPHSHELKSVFPYYDLMWKVDKVKTTSFIKAFWNSNVIDWSRLEFDNLGEYDKKMGLLWRSEYQEPEPFYEGGGNTNISTGSDLIYAAGMFTALSGEDSALIWAKRMTKQYVSARHPVTDLGAYSYSKLKRHIVQPDGQVTDQFNSLDYGDRAENQFGNVFPGIALDGWVLFDGAGLYTAPSLMFLELGERLGDKGKEFIDWTLSGLYAYAKYAYKTADNTFSPMWANGTDLTGYALKRTGYYGPEEYVLRPLKANEMFLFTYTRALLFSGGTVCWTYFQDKDTSIVRSMQRGLGLGDLGSQRYRDINFDTGISSPYAIFALLERYRWTRDQATLRLAEKIADNLLAKRFRNGFFITDGDSTISEFDAIEPLAILALEATLRGEPEKVPAFSGGSNHFDQKTK